MEGNFVPIRKENLSRYPKNWAVISLHIRFERAGGRCECTGQCGQDHGGRCEARHGFEHPETKSLVVLTTMHLNHQPEDNRDENLLAGCQRCHNKYDAPMRQAGVKERRDAAKAKEHARRMDKAGQMQFELECRGWKNGN